MSDTIDIRGIDRAELLAALYNSSRPLGLGFLQFDPSPLTADEARELIVQATEPPYREGGSERAYFDYLKGRVMKVEMLADDFDPWLYDRDNGQGAASAVIERLRVSA